MKTNFTRLLVSVALLLSYGTTQAQVTYDTSVEFDYFEQFKSTSNFMYTFTGVEKQFGQSELTLFDHSGNELNRIILEGKTRPILKYTALSGDNTVFALDNDKYLFVDAKGNEVDEKSFEGADKVKNEMLVATSTGFYVVQQVKVKKVGVGLRIKMYDSAGNESWSYEKFPEKGRYNFAECSVLENGTLGVIFTKGGMSYDKGFLVLSPSGDEVAFNNLTLTEDQLSNSELRVGLNGNWYYTGDFGNSNDGKSGPQGVTTGNPFGMAIIQLDGESGAQVSETIVGFEEFQALAGNKKPNGDPVYTQNSPILQILDIVSYNGKNYFMTESVLASAKTITDPNSSSEAPTKITFDSMTLLDYYLIECDNPMSNPIRIWKNERVVEIKRGGSFDNQYSARRDMIENDLFSYQGMVGNKIITRGYAQMHNYYTLIDLSKGAENITSRTYWSRAIGSDFNAFPPKSVYYKNRLGAFSTDYFSNEGILSVKDGFMLYAYDTRSNQLQLAKLNF